jgi:hypothetical protein
MTCNDLLWEPLVIGAVQNVVSGYRREDEGLGGCGF